MSLEFSTNFILVIFNLRNNFPTSFGAVVPRSIEENFFSPFDEYIPTYIDATWGMTAISDGCSFRWLVKIATDRTRRTLQKWNNKAKNEKKRAQVEGLWETWRARRRRRWETNRRWNANVETRRSRKFPRHSGFLLAYLHEWHFIRTFCRKTGKRKDSAHARQLVAPFPLFPARQRDKLKNTIA